MQVAVRRDAFISVRVHLSIPGPGGVKILRRLDPVLTQTTSDIGTLENIQDLFTIC